MPSSSLDDYPMSIQFCGTAHHRWAFVSLEGSDTYHGAAVELYNFSGTTFQMEFTPARPGKYKLAVDLISQDGHIPLFKGRGHTISISGPLQVATAAQMKRCEGSLPSRGTWVRCRGEGVAAAGECLRW
jgi:hypothetical protein